MDEILTMMRRVHSELMTLFDEQQESIERIEQRLSKIERDIERAIAQLNLANNQIKDLINIAK